MVMLVLQKKKKKKKNCFLLNRRNQYMQDVPKITYTGLTSPRDQSMNIGDFHRAGLVHPSLSVRPADKAGIGCSAAHTAK